MLALVLASSLQPGCAGQEPGERPLRPAGSFDAEAFTRIRGLYELRDGRVLVADQTEKSLYRLDLKAGTRERIGRHGEGPGEYDVPLGLLPFRADSALMIDLFNDRLAVLDPTGEIVRFEPLLRPGLGTPDAADTLGNLYSDDIASVRVAKQQDPGADRARLLRFDLVTGRLDTLGTLSVPGPVNPGPLPEYDAWAVGRDGAVAIVRDGAEYRVDRLRGDGALTRGRAVDEQRISLSRADREALADRGGAGVSLSGRTGRGRGPGPRLPDRFPRTSSSGVWVDRDGRVHVVRLRHLDEPRPLVDVFDSEGRRVDRYRLPDARRIVGFGADRLYAIHTDPLGFQWIEWYDLP